MKKTIVLFLIISGFIFIFISKQSVQTITYFPIDNTNNFVSAKTTLELPTNQLEDSYKIDWGVSSKSSHPLYLRQDVGLLFHNGNLKGVRSVWKENVAEISFGERLKNQENGQFQAISFHHGEVHDSNDIIKSIQTMSHDNLYITKQDNQVIAFKEPLDDVQIALKRETDMEVKKKLEAYWQKLFDHFEIKQENYDLIPLTDLYIYQTKPLTGLNQAQTQKITGQLWEGIYKNYVLEAIKMKQHIDPNYLPLILIDKNHTELLVIYELNGKKSILKQRFSF